MLATASAQVCVPLGHSSLYFYLRGADGDVRCVTSSLTDIPPCADAAAAAAAAACLSAEAQLITWTDWECKSASSLAIIAMPRGAPAG